MARTKQVGDLIKDTGIRDGSSESDTIRMWENYREQALLWRALALIQLPSLIIVSLLAFTMYSNRKIFLNVPQAPLPSVYEANKLPNAVFVEAAQNFVNLIATYQHQIARRQYVRAAEYLVEPLLSKFSDQMLQGELPAIEGTSRTQVFYIDPNKTEVTRQEGNKVVVNLTGERLKFIAGKELPIEKTVYRVTMTTVPRNDLNPYGIVVSNLAIEDIKR